MEDYYAQTFGYSMYLLLGAMVIVGLIFRFFNYLSYRQNTGDVSYRGEMTPSSSLLARLHTSYKKHFETPALFGHRHATPAYSYFSLPTRLQAFFVSYPYPRQHLQS